MFYYRINGTLCCSLNGELDFPREELYGRGTDEKEAREKASGEEELVFLFERSPKNCRASFRVTDPALLYQDREDVSWLNKNVLGEGMRDEIVDSFIKEGKMRAVNLNHPRFQEILKEKPEKKKKRVHDTGHRRCGKYSFDRPPSVRRRCDKLHRNLRYLRQGDGPLGI